MFKGQYKVSVWKYANSLSTFPCTAVNPGDENDLDDVEEMSMEPVQKRLRLEDMGEATDDHIIQHVTTIEVWRWLDVMANTSSFFMPPPFEEWWRGIKCSPCPCVRPLSKFGVRSITFERLHRFNSKLVCWYIVSKHRSSSIWVTIH